MAALHIKNAPRLNDDPKDDDKVKCIDKYIVTYLTRVEN